MTYAAWGMGYSAVFRQMAVEAMQRAVEDLANPNLGKHKARDGASMSYTPRAAEAVILSVTALEAGINEIAVMLRRGFPPTLRPLPDDFAKRRLVDRWKLVPMVGTDATVDLGREPWQDLTALVELRNGLVHFQWEADGVPRFIRALQARGLALPDKPGIYWVDAALTDRVARWSISTTDRVFAELTRLMKRVGDPNWVWK